MLTVDPWEIRSVVNGSIRLDGGAMFGVVPKVLWEKEAPADQINRIALATRTLLAIDRSGSRVLLVDTGCGTKWEPELARRYAITHDPNAIPDALRLAGLGAEDVTDVVISHLHFDHNGGLTEWVDRPGGSARLCYPNARHWIHRRHWEHARKPHVKDRASFIEADYAPLAEAGALHFVDGTEPDPAYPDLAWYVSEGHTPGQLHAVLGSGDRRLLFTGDIIPTSVHLRLGWVMAYDVLPMTTIAEKRTIYRRCLDEGWLLAFPHDPQVGGIAFDGTPEKPAIARVLDL